MQADYLLLESGIYSKTHRWHTGFTENLSEKEQLALKYLYIETSDLLFGIMEAYCHVKILGMNTELV
jgi:hypothetical protein